MNSTAYRNNGTRNLKVIPSTRRHVYFYLLLLLGTAVAHNIWQACQTGASRPEVDQVRELVATVQGFKH